MRLEYANDPDMEIHTRDVQLATEHYRPRGLAAKAGAGFQIYARRGEADRLRRVRDERELHTVIFSLSTFLNPVSPTLAASATPKTRLAFSTSWPHTPGTSPCASFCNSREPKAGTRAWLSPKNSLPRATPQPAPFSAMVSCTTYSLASCTGPSAGKIFATAVPIPSNTFAHGSLSWTSS